MRTTKAQLEEKLEAAEAASCRQTAVAARAVASKQQTELENEKLKADLSAAGECISQLKQDKQDLRDHLRAALNTEPQQTLRQKLIALLSRFVDWLAHKLGWE